MADKKTAKTGTSGGASAAGKPRVKRIRARDLIEKRRAIWKERRDLEYDAQYVRAAVRKILSEEALRAEIVERPYLLIEIAFYIVDKERRTVPFFFNDVQQDFIGKLETLGTSKPFFILKGRQQGFTSLITAIQLSFAIVRKNFSGFTIADRSDNTMAIFNDKARVVYERLPDELKPSEKFNSRNELFFDKLNSSWRIATATDQVGRSRTLNFVHFSEVAFYDCQLSNLQKSIGEAIVAGAIIVYETTANGFNQAKELWDAGSCHNLFYEWWRTPEYRCTEYEYIEMADGWLSERIKFLSDAGCDREQIAWYAKKYAGYIDKSAIRQEYPCTPEEAFVASGDCVFDMEALNNQMAAASLIKPAKVGYFAYKKECTPVLDSEGNPVDVEWAIRDIRFIETRDGYITIHEEPRVKYDKYGEVTALAPYVIGGDTAGSGADYFTAKVICNLDGRCAATLHKQRIDEDLYAEQMYCLGRYYHDALIGVEINYSREPTRVLAKKYRYPNLYMRERLDRMTDKVEMDYGFETTTRTKPIIIAELVELMRSDPTVEVDVETLREMTTFVKKDNGRQEAIEGAHDDLVMACAIAHFISKKQTNRWIDAPGVDTVNRFIEENFGRVAERTNEFMDWEDF